MTARPSARSLGSAISLSAGLDGRVPVQADYDPDEPREYHESHVWVLYDRWAECEGCGVRDHWPAAEAVCQPGSEQGKRAIQIQDALDILLADLQSFRAWWISKGLGDRRPTIEEWTAEFLEWTRARGGRR